MIELKQLLENGVSPCHVVKESTSILKEEGFLPLTMTETWDIQWGGKYYIEYHHTTFVAFTVGEAYTSGKAIRMAAAHTDFPCLRIKPNPEVNANGYGELNIEVYGGAILNTWLDRPLSIAGRAALKSSDLLHPRIELVDFKRPLLTIPNLAVHMNRQVNKGIELNKQTDMLPILTMLPKEMKDSRFFMDMLAAELKVDADDILDYELTVYCAQKPEELGLHSEFLLSPRLDNITSVYALLKGILAERTDGINVIAAFDHEEIGSGSKQGAASLLLRDILSRILQALGSSEEEVLRGLYQNILLSVDVAHGLHPNQAGKMDITNQPVLNGGFCIKEACCQSYATDCEAVGILQQICESKKIPYQKFVNRSDMPGGGTLGAIASCLLPVLAVDLGVPLLAMHSASELMGTKDMDALAACVRAFFEI